MLEDAAEIHLCSYLTTRLQQQEETVRNALSTAPRNVYVILRRQISGTTNPVPSRPTCRLYGEEELLKALGLRLPLELALFTLARIYDAIHMRLCQTVAEKRRRAPDHVTVNYQYVNVLPLSEGIEEGRDIGQEEVVFLRKEDKKPIHGMWKPVTTMSFDQLPVLTSLASRLPGECSNSHDYAGIGGGGGSDVISASLLGQLLRGHGKEMNILISTRTWSTGSQGGKGSKIGVKREVYNHDGPVEVGGQPVPGTFRFRSGTYSEGRSLEAILLSNHEHVFMVLDQSESMSDIPHDDRAELKDQFDAVLDQAQPAIDSVLIVDTGGDVFGGDDTGTTTPDQDLRVQRAMSASCSQRNLITAVVSPGVDAPNDAPQKALEAGGVLYRPSTEEKDMFLDLLIDKYKMDGSDPTRFGKTTLALQARLRGVVGWTSLALPEHVVDTWENPWSSFVYIHECMSDIILLPTKKFLPCIEGTGRRS